MKTIAERFWGMVQKTEGCWLWTGYRNRDGYGQIRVGARTLRAHRVAWELSGRVLTDLPLLHSCDNRRCVNPTHLHHGTQEQNMLEAHARGRFACGEASRNSKLTRVDVETIRAEFAGGGVKQTTLARRFGVHAQTVFRIIKGELWKRAPKASAPR